MEKKENGIDWIGHYLLLGEMENRRILLVEEDGSLVLGQKIGRIVAEDVRVSI